MRPIWFGLAFGESGQVSPAAFRVHAGNRIRRRWSMEMVSRDMKALGMYPFRFDLFRLCPQSGKDS